MKKYFILAIVAAATISGCTKDPVLPKDPSDNVDRLRYYQEIKDVRPDWTNQGFWEEDDQYFKVGESFVFDTFDHVVLFDMFEILTLLCLLGTLKVLKRL